MVPQKAVQVAILSGQDDRAAGAADGVGDITFLEEHALIRQPIHVRRGVDLRTIGTDGVGRVVISEDEQNIRPLRGVE